MPPLLTLRCPHCSSQEISFANCELYRPNGSWSFTFNDGSLSMVERDRDPAHHSRIRLVLACDACTESMHLEVEESASGILFGFKKREGADEPVSLEQVITSLEE